VNLVAMTMRRGEIVYKEANVSWKDELSSAWPTSQKGDAT
jgi:hypothetical protein